MVKTVKQRDGEAQAVPQPALQSGAKLVNLVAGVNNGNSTLVCAYGLGVEPTVFISESWVYEHHGSVDDLNPISNSMGLTFEYVNGDAEQFKGRVFQCGKAALSTKGSTDAQLMGDAADNKVQYGLPMHLFGLVSQHLGCETINVTLVSSIHKQRLASSLKAQLIGTHNIQVLSREADLTLKRRPVTITFTSTGIVPEGYDALWKLAGAGVKDNAQIDLNAINLVIDGGAGSFDVLRFDGPVKAQSATLPLAGRHIVNALLDSEALLAQFPEDFEVHRGLIESAIKDGSWTYSKGRVNVNFNQIGKDIILGMIPRWKSYVDNISNGHAIDKTALVGGLFETKYTPSDNSDDKAWSLAELFKSQFLTHDFVISRTPQTDGALGNYQIALAMGGS